MRRIQPARRSIVFRDLENDPPGAKPRSIGQGCVKHCSGHSGVPVRGKHPEGKNLAFVARHATKNEGGWTGRTECNETERAGHREQAGDRFRAPGFLEALLMERRDDRHVHGARIEDPELCRHWSRRQPA